MPELSNIPGPSMPEHTLLLSPSQSEVLETTKQSTPSYIKKSQHLTSRSNCKNNRRPLGNISNDNENLISSNNLENIIQQLVKEG